MKKTAYLIHWNQAEAETLADEIRGLGWEISGVEAEDGYRGGKMVQEIQPDVVVIYLTRLPSHGRETAAYLQTVKSTRSIPIIFVGGEGAALEKTKDKVPSAVFTSGEGLSSALSEAGSR